MSRPFFASRQFVAGFGAALAALSVAVAAAALSGSPNGHAQLPPFKWGEHMELMAGDELAGFRDRAFRFCSRADRTLEPLDCMAVQDATIMHIPRLRRRLAEAHDREYGRRAIDACERLYREHRAEDARILYHCLGHEERIANHRPG